MHRREWFKKSSLLAGSALGLPKFLTWDAHGARRKVLTIAHITDVHIRPENNIPERFKQCLEEIQQKQAPDFFLNGGDTIHAADYSDISRERVLEQWNAWDECSQQLSQPIYSCLGNHDMWWAAPDEKDSMYGKKYVLERLNMPDPYYRVRKNGWHFIILDGNNENVSLDDEQFVWLKKELSQIPGYEHVLIMSHHPILGVSGHFYSSDHHSDFEKLTDLFYNYQNVKACISGHMHLLESAVYNNVQYFCNGAISGFWWGDGNERSAGKGYYRETPPGYTLLNLYNNGDVEREYFPHIY